MGHGHGFGAAQGDAQPDRFPPAQQEETKRLCDDARRDVAVVDVDAARAAKRRNEAVKERASIQAELRAARKSGSREKSEFFRARRTVAKARDLARRGDIAEAEALCLEQVERVHARLAADSTYRREYLDGLERAAEESATRAKPGRRRRRPRRCGRRRR